MRRHRSRCFADDSAQQFVGADAHIGPLVRIHRTAVDAATPRPCLRRPTFSAAPEKVGKKRRWTRFILRADAREFLAAPRPERPDGRRIAIFPIAYGSDECTTRICGQPAIIPVLLISGILGRLRFRTATQMACHFHGSVFCHLPAWKLLSMRALSPRRRRCSSALQRDYRVLAAAFFYGLILWHRGTIRYPAPLFAHFFWQDRRNQIANQRSVCNLERTSNGTDETCRLRRGEGLREAPRAQALRRAIGLAERMQSEASLGVCEDEGLRSNSCGVAASTAVRGKRTKRRAFPPAVAAYAD